MRQHASLETKELILEALEKKYEVGAIIKRQDVLQVLKELGSDVIGISTDWCPAWLNGEIAQRTGVFKPSPSGKNGDINLTVLRKVLEEERGKSKTNKIKLIPTNPIEEADAKAGHRKSLVQITLRPEQAKFREKLMIVYGRKCVITGCKIPEILQAAHIVPYAKNPKNHIINGLLLRSDIHALFDRGLLEIERKPTAEYLEVILAPSLQREHDYSPLHKRKIALEIDKANYPCSEALEYHKKLIAKCSEVNDENRKHENLRAFAPSR
jgi:hypothetical protein